MKALTQPKNVSPSSIRVAHHRTCDQPQRLVAPFGHEQGNYGRKTVPEERGYRAYFFSASDHIRDVRGIKVSRDLDAIAEAQALLAKSEYAFVEVYEEWRLVWRSDRERLVA
jgi:hypothetical protein